MMIDRLEPRLQYANLSGLIYADADGSETFDANESALRGTTVFIDANGNGTLDSGEQSTTADKKGRYTFSGLVAGDYIVGTTVDTVSVKSTDVGPNGTKQGRFDIEVRGLETASADVRAAFVNAAQRWESVITGDMPDITQRDGSVIDDLIIDAKIGVIDGVDNILGYAAPSEYRTGSSIPYRGFMRFDSADLESLKSEGGLGDVILHEMGHVLGFGTIWDRLGLLTGNGSRNPRFVGDAATTQYNRLFKTNNLSVPVENSGGSGTRNSHWRESILTDELMTGYSPSGSTPAPLSAITVGEFADEGYQVDFNAADEWNPATAEVTRTTALDLGGVANERLITLGQDDTVLTANFGYQTNSAPVIRAFTIAPSPVAQGTNITLAASAITDADGDTLAGVSFWRESNGIEGLQKTGDTLIGVKTTTKQRQYRIETSTAGLLGDTAFYAVATDSAGYSGRRTGVVNIQSTTIPASIPTQLSVRTRTANVTRFSFVDTDGDVTGYRIELATRSDFGTQSLVRTFNISSETTGVTIGNLTAGVTYYIRVRAFNLAGATQYSTPLSFETI